MQKTNLCCNCNSITYDIVWRYFNMNLWHIQTILHSKKESWKPREKLLGLVWEFLDRKAATLTRDSFSCGEKCENPLQTKSYRVNEQSNEGYDIWKVHVKGKQDGSSPDLDFYLKVWASWHTTVGSSCCRWS